MRKEFVGIVEELALNDDSIIFITGDLGYNACEKLQETLGDRFINAGVAEQNMIGIAAGMASRGYKVFCYSIAPFIVYRCLEQMRNDVCFHNLPVFIVGNGGGYGYGIMGSTHHAISDLACLASLPNIKCWVPAFLEDVKVLTQKIVEEGRPAYLRLGRGIPNPFGRLEPHSNFNVVLKVLEPKVTVLALGPLVHNALGALSDEALKNTCDILTVVELPLGELPEIFLKSISRSKRLLVLEEHVSTGGLGQAISLKLLESNIHLQSFKSLVAEHYPTELYGSQDYHVQEAGMDEEGIIKVVKELLKPGADMTK